MCPWIRDVVHVCQLCFEPLEPPVTPVVDHDGQDQGTQEHNYQDANERSLISRAPAWCRVTAERMVTTAGAPSMRDQVINGVRVHRNLGVYCAVRTWRTQ